MKCIVGVSIFVLLLNGIVLAEGITLGRFIEIHDQGGKLAESTNMHIGALGKGICGK